MSSRIGRKSSFSRQLANLEHPSNSVTFGYKHKQEVTKGLVIDICGAYKPDSIFIDENYVGYKNFSTGVFFIVGVYDKDEIAVVSWRKSEGELRTLHGTDANIIGRECSIFSAEQTKSSLLEGEIVFNKSLSSEISSFGSSEYMSNSFFVGLSTNYIDQINDKRIPNTMPLGEVWRRLKT
jgi:hypothetical protein